MKKNKTQKISLKDRIFNLWVLLKRSIPYALTALAGVAISWYSLESFDSLATWYSLPITGLFTGLLTLIIPLKGKNFHPVYAVTCTGLTIFSIILMKHWVTSNVWKFIFTLAIVIVVAFLSDLILSKSKPSLEDLILDGIISIIATVAMVYLPPMLIIAVLVIVYFTVLYIQIKPEYTTRFRKAKESTTTTTTTTE